MERSSKSSANAGVVVNTKDPMIVVIEVSKTARREASNVVVDVLDVVVETTVNASVNGVANASVMAAT